MKEIPLTQGKVALIDDEDYSLVSGYRWHAEKMKGIFMPPEMGAKIRIDIRLECTMTF